MISAPALLLNDEGGGTASFPADGLTDDSGLIVLTADDGTTVLTAG